jgi:hypothetical protein
MFKCCSHRKVTRLSPSEHIYETPLPMFSIRDRVSSPPIPPPRRTRLILDENGNLYPPSNLIYRNSNSQMINHSNSNETRFLAQCRGTDNDAFLTTNALLSSVNPVLGVHQKNRQPGMGLKLSVSGNYNTCQTQTGYSQSSLSTDKSQFIVPYNNEQNLDFRYGTDVDVRPRYYKSAPHGTFVPTPDSKCLQLQYDGIMANNLCSSGTINKPSYKLRKYNSYSITSPSSNLEKHINLLKCQWTRSKSAGPYQFQPLGLVPQGIHNTYSTNSEFFPMQRTCNSLNAGSGTIVSSHSQTQPKGGYNRVLSTIEPLMTVDISIKNERNGIVITRKFFI